MIRTFIAVEIPEDLKGALEQVQGLFREARTRVRWVRPAAMHVTLKFLGDVEEERIPEIGAALEAACKGRPSFAIRFSGAGAFPGTNRPRVLWVGIREGTEELTAILRDLDPRLGDLGFPEEKRPFRPHMTLGRIKEVRDLPGLQALMEVNREVDVGSMTADAVHVIESRLRREGAVYRSQLTVPLENRDTPLFSENK